MLDSDGLDGMMEEIGRRAGDAAARLASESAEVRSQAILAAADAICQRRERILAANAQDMEDAGAKGLSKAMMDRLMLDADRIGGIADAQRSVAAQPDPVGEVMAHWKVESGLDIRRVRTPLGVIGVIYESRPNVTADVASLCLKSGNAAILRCGSDSFRTSTAIHECVLEGLQAAGLPEDCVQMVPTRDRAAVSRLVAMTEHVDVIVPRGGKGLVELVQREARVPVFAHLEGIVHVYVDAAADPRKALDVVLNSKTRRTGICGAAECLLVHEAVAETLGRDLLAALIGAGVEVRTEGALAAVAGTVAAAAQDWGREYLDSIIAARTVANVEEAVAHIRRHHSGHTDCIVTEDDAAADAFFAGLDSAILMRNASTQFADGGEFGLGAEIGIATGKMHARGPVGAAQLTSFKYLVVGDGTVRG